MTTVRVTIGRVVLVAGVIVLLFIPYLLWGTGIVTARHQSALRAEFLQAEAAVHTDEQQLLHPLPHSGAPEVAPPLADPPLGSAVGILTIPKIGLSMAIVEGTGTAELRAGPGHYPSTPLPGQSGNAAIAGHRTTYLHPFYNLNELAPGDPIEITTLQGRFVYSVLSEEAVAPTDVAVVAPTPFPELTLTTCNPRYSASQRLVVHARLTASSLTRLTASALPTKITVPALKPVAESTGGSWTAVALWGALVLVVTIGAWIAVARSSGWRKGVLATAGTLVWLALLYGLFGAVAPFVPASF